MPRFEKIQSKLTSNSAYVRRREPSTFYCIYEVMDRHGALEWTKPNIHARLSIRPLKSTKVFFLVDIVLVCYLCVCSQCYILFHLELVNFLVQCQELSQ